MADAEKNASSVGIAQVESSVIKEYYKYFEDHPVDGVILTSHPAPAAYTDSRYEPFYGSDSIETFDAWMATGKVGGIVFYPRAFPCPGGDVVCGAKNKILFRKVMKHKVVFEKTYYGTPCYILVPVVSS